MKASKYVLKRIKVLIVFNVHSRKVENLGFHSKLCARFKPRSLTF